MQAGWIKKSLYLLCLGLPMVLATIGTGQTAVGADQGGTASVLDRVQKENDSELSELIRIAVTNRKNVSEQERLEIVRKVTQSHAQIKLLDQQIELIARKIDSAAGPAEMRYELLPAKAELESKRTTEPANLRETMGVIPKFPFEEKPVRSLKTWLHLNVADQRVYVTATLTPSLGDWGRTSYRSVGLLSEQETLDYLRGRFKDKSNLPIRIDVHHTYAMGGTAQDLQGKIVSLALETDSQMEAEVHVEPVTWVGSGESTFFLRDGEIRTLYPRPVQRPDKTDRLLATGRVARDDLEQHILWRLLHPGNVPLKFRIEYDGASTDLAKQVADTVKAVAKRLGITELVEVATVSVQPVPEAAFLGRWQAKTDGEIREIEFQPRGQSRLTMSTGPKTTVQAPWTLATKEVFIDSRNMVTHRGYINEEGNLVIEQGGIRPQGTWHGGGADEQQHKIFQRVK